ncbi:MAG: hypothetical protein A3J07_02755 [Candidatus Doudnabacteria bacterium RIFCSPLOWO2_02_FULL_49_13]|uniref:Methyltransferase domain-containing protein n=1 Tax=Candidatus Doudnabacteria bacterium RIFCSPHIGHO2_12_FULL_48_16 TaxID=1817838 RepID=A0A1F5PL63_9BACT|nr:MAG: hypothetical protein A3B77_01395 [Candidatus Doudnabacteria bacterium RIFCSPHIGHO2_02_FULL_49_24]OGE88120.1 MAG: hypothetical protein A2760_00930 [Candidatus Doudnabacteria bacterium RIFCSPHIGHO2_01_FULL_50_67]OGE90597.1 MAG: hypothetical protein A3E29_02265 [Candidatus Doudnabacteria bacterium RIFCSPHIGHO2_12_FULL_48_16]OGE96479.1 MAG: hypothetical protein A2990_04330 [Candidatus Doudnabacteria bacterium RIFCSPLOWO2_01_FULL_49_40]OGF02990.1 MAG: hypothetical protein A3J07_02755 [Candid
MKDNWHDPKFAMGWDADAAVNNPSRARLLDLLLTIITDSYSNDGMILDLGFGTGLVEEMIFNKIPAAQIVGVDSSEAMIAKAEDRLKGRNMITIQHDLNEIKNLKLPQGQYQFAITSFALHEIPSIHKQEIFKFIYKNLVSGGMYVLVDRFKIESDSLASAYESQWRSQTKSATWTDWKEPFAEYKKRMSIKEDFPDLVEDQLAWLRESGFKAACLQLEFDRGLIVGLKS